MSEATELGSGVLNLTISEMLWLCYTASASHEQRIMTACHNESRQLMEALSGKKSLDELNSDQLHDVVRGTLLRCSKIMELGQ